MIKETIQRAKGVRDFGPAEKIERDSIISILKKVFESFGFAPIETPVLERYELLASKFGQGEQSDSMKETFKLTDQGERKLVLRNEFTVPLARYVAMNPEIKFPFKRYQIGSVFRDGPLKLGRYREFYQCDIDTIGSTSLATDAELITIAQKVFAELGFEVEICINNRKLLNAILASFGVAEKDLIEVIISIDKLDKINEAGVAKDLAEKGIIIENLDDILKLLNTKGSNQKKLEVIESAIGETEGLAEINETLKYLLNDSNVIFLPSLARGLAYYTGNVFEVFLKDKTILSSAVSGGGRYDNMIGGFLDSNETIGAVGISFGLETIIDARKKLGQENNQKTLTQIYLAPIGAENLKSCLALAEQIRALGINVDIDLENRKLKKNLEYAVSLGIPYVGIIGSDELEQNKIMLRNLAKGKQQLVSINELTGLLS